METKPEKSILEFFCRHLVGLSIAYQIEGDEGKNERPRFATYSGTLLIVRGSLFFLTAGHVLKEIEDRLADDRIDIRECVLSDVFGWKRISNRPIPFDLKGCRLFYIDDDEAGLDFGVIHLDPYYGRLLAKNGMIAITEEHWIRPRPGKFDLYAILGFPQELTSKHLSDSGEGSVEPMMLFVDPFESERDRSQTRHPRFVGKVGSNLPISSIKGMSGGPIIGVRIGEQVRYWIIALQSAWNPRNRVVYGCDFSTLAALMTQSLDPDPPSSG